MCIKFELRWKNPLKCNGPRIRLIVACLSQNVASFFIGWGLAKTLINSLVLGRYEWDSKNGIFNLVLLIVFFRSSDDHAFQWMPQDLTNDKSTLVQVMAWCCQATSHYLSQCWLSPLSSYGIARPQWVNQKKTFHPTVPNLWFFSREKINSSFPDGLVLSCTRTSASTTLSFNDIMCFFRYFEVETLAPKSLLL